MLNNNVLLVAVACGALLATSAHTEIVYQVSTFAGTVTNFGSADGTGIAAKFNRPQGVAVDGSGNVYVADSENCTIRNRQVCRSC